MRKRAGLARALVLEPKILLADEPSSGLDRITAAEIDELLVRRKTEYGTALILVTHVVHGARRVADQVAVLDKGNIVAFGPVDEVSQSENDVDSQDSLRSEGMPKRFLAVGIFYAPPGLTLFALGIFLVGSRHEHSPATCFFTQSSPSSMALPRAPRCKLPVWMQARYPE